MSSAPISSSLTPAFSKDDCDRLLLALHDALNDLNLYHDDINSLEALVRKEDSIIALGPVLLNIDTSMRDEAHLPAWLNSSDEQPSFACKLEAALFMAMKLQQNRLIVKERNVNLKERLLREPSDVTESLSSLSMILPSKLETKLSEKQQASIRSCYNLLKADYENRRRGMRQRLEILETTLAGNSTTADPEAEPLSPQPQQQQQQQQQPTHASLIDHFSRPTSSESQLKHASTIQKPVISSITDRGGRIEEESRGRMPEWDDVRKPSKPPSKPPAVATLTDEVAASTSSTLDSRKRGNGDKPMTGQRKKINDQSS